MRKIRLRFRKYVERFAQWRKSKKKRFLKWLDFKANQYITYRNNRIISTVANNMKDEQIQLAIDSPLKIVCKNNPLAKMDSKITREVYTTTGGIHIPYVKRVEYGDGSSTLITIERTDIIYRDATWWKSRESSGKGPYVRCR